jgi:endonuclease YncB( thermonuclease family)
MIWPRTAAGLAWAVLLAPGLARAEEPPCRPAGRTEERLAMVGPRGELQLESGARARLDGVRWPDEPALAARAEAWLASHRGRPLEVVWRGETDRWGRRGADAVSEAGSEPVDLAAGLVAAGLALVDAGEGDALCRPALLVAEGAARAGGRGLWAEPVARADEAARLAGSAGRFVVAEGRVRSVGERRAWTYLNFAAPGVESLTVTLARRTWRTLVGRGVDAAGLRGRMVRARGLVEVRRGPVIEVTAPEMLEVLDGAGQDGPRDGMTRRGAAGRARNGR